LIIIYKPANGDAVDPIVILDYTRSDEQYSLAQITRYVFSLGIQAAKGKTVNIQNLKTYSLDYSMVFSHSGINYGDSLKTKFTATILNAPMELIGLLNIKQYISEENINALSTALNKIIDPQAFFPTGAFVIKPNSNSTDIISRTFMLFSTPFNFDTRRLNSTLELHGSEFDSMVMRLKFSVNINKQTPLLSQLKTIFGAQGFTVNVDPQSVPVLSSLVPVVDRYYPPSTINSVMDEVCRDNSIAHVTDSDSKTIFLQALRPNTAPRDGTKIFTFNNYVPGSNVISGFSLQNYATCNFEAEAVDVKLFESVRVYDDSFNPGQFDNLRKLPEVIPVGKARLNGYRFYVLEYSYQDSRVKTSVSIRGSNNWLISNFKLDVFLENKVYQGATL